MFNSHRGSPLSFKSSSFLGGFIPQGNRHYQSNVVLESTQTIDVAYFTAQLETVFHAILFWQFSFIWPNISVLQ